MNICNKLFGLLGCVMFFYIQCTHAKNATVEVFDIKYDTIVCDSLKNANATKKLNELKSKNKKKEGIVKKQESFYEKFPEVFTIEHMLTKKRPVLSPRDSSRFAEFTQLRQNAKDKEALPKKNVQSKQSVVKTIIPDNKKDGDNGDEERKKEECKKARTSANAEKKLKKTKDKKNKYDIEKYKGEPGNTKKAIANYSKESDKLSPKKKTVCIDSLTNESLKQEEKHSRELDRKIELLEWANGKTDTIIFKKYIFKTLREPYNEDVKNACKTIIDFFVENYNNYAIGTKKYKEIYMPMIDKYDRYREEVLTYLNNRKVSYQKYNYDMKYINPRKGFNETEYYKFYKDRNVDPWQSIEYLDFVLEDWEKAIDRNEITEEKMNELIERLEPRP